MKEEFDDIRPYRDEEIPAAMSRIADSPAMPLLASYVCPDLSLDDVKNLVRSFKTVKEFQYGIMHKVNEQIIHNSITEFTFEGSDKLQKNTPYLFVSNHRDIMLDASLLQNALVDSGFETTQITFGANLMMNPLVVDIGKSNKMFRVERPGGSIKDRTKDGNDQTDQGIIKMFCMSKPENKIGALSELNIVPVAVSYEWESCDILKALELYASQNVKYIKKPGEDLNSILTGILKPKGRVHFQLCELVTEGDLIEFNNCTNNEYHKQVAQLIDKRILRAYKLWPNNYIAHDLLYGQRRFANKYTREEKDAFMERLSKLERFDSDLDALKDIFLGIYANPVSNKLKL